MENSIDQFEEEIDIMVEPDVEFVAEAVAETVAEQVAEPAAEQVAEPAAEQVAEPVAEQVAEPVAEPVAETVAESNETILTGNISMVQDTPLPLQEPSPAEVAVEKVSKTADETLKEFIHTQQELIKGLAARITLLDSSLKEQTAYINRLNKEIKDAFTHNGKVITGWLGTKDRQIAELKKIADEVASQREAMNHANSMESRLANMEKALHRIQNRVALR